MASIDRKFVPFYITFDTPIAVDSTGVHADLTGLGAILLPFASSRLGLTHTVLCHVHTFGFRFGSVSGASSMSWLLVGEGNQGMTQKKTSTITATGDSEGTAAENLDVATLMDWSDEVNIRAVTNAGTLNITAVYGLFEIG